MANYVECLECGTDTITAHVAGCNTGTGSYQIVKGDSMKLTTRGEIALAIGATILGLIGLRLFAIVTVKIGQALGIV